MRIVAITAVFAVALALGGSTARSDTKECQDALDRYTAVLHDVVGALHRYGGCVAESRGHDDCSIEFSTLQSAQDDFESAVSSYQSDCS